MSEGCIFCSAVVQRQPVFIVTQLRVNCIPVLSVGGVSSAFHLWNGFALQPLSTAILIVEVEDCGR